MTVVETAHRFVATPSTGEVSAVLTRPAHATALLALAHGAGADMHHAFMVDITAELAARGLAVLRYQFPYTERGGKRPDPKPRLVATVRAAVELARSLSEGRPVLAGGKSMGGRMTSLAAVDGGLPGVHGLVFLGFPLHPAKAPATDRAAHLPAVPLPMLFVQGTRDELADLELLRPVLASLPTAHLHLVPDGNHAFEVRKTRGHDPAAVKPGIADAVATWAAGLV